MTDDELLTKPIVIIGPPRSGTSILMSLLAEHPALARINEPRLTWRFGNDQGSDCLRPEQARPDVRQHIRGRFAAMIREQGAERMVEKTPSNALRPAFVEAVLPGCLFLNILRHPFDAILSIRDAWGAKPGMKGMTGHRWRTRLGEMDVRRAPHYAIELARRALPRFSGGLVGRTEWGPRLPGMQALMRELSVLELACLQWRACVEISCRYGRALPSDRYLEVRLEDLTRDLMERVLGFCQVEGHPGFWQRFEQQMDRGQAGRHRDRASPEELERIRSWVGPSLDWAGYGDPDVLA